MFQNLTGFEIDTLPYEFNLTDGHAFRSWTLREDAIISRTPELFRIASRRSQREFEQAYISDFLKLARQTHSEASVGYLLCFTASMALEVIANWLRLNGQSLTLIEPAFDNLADIFRRHGVPLHPFPDDWMEAAPAEFADRLREIRDPCICLVTPNNPTGRALPEENLRLLAEHCAEHRKLLILDNCFRAYLPRGDVYDQYRILLESGARFISIEDTGKTWPTAEIKAPFFAVSRAAGLYQQFYDIYTDFLLHVSPVAVRLLHEFVRLSQDDDLAAVHKVVRVNRETLYRTIAGTFLTPCERPFASLAWLRIDAPIRSAELKRVLDSHGVYVLAGNLFFWSDHRRGDRYIRVALTRDADMFAAATARLGEVCRTPALLEAAAAAR